MSLKVGDQVMLVWGCCAEMRARLGEIGTVVAVQPEVYMISQCGYETVRAGAVVTIGPGGWCPVSWLKKIEPDSDLQSIDCDEEITA